MSRRPPELDEARLRRFEALYRASFDDVTRFVARRVDAPADVADVVAATFAVALDSWDRYDPARSPAIAWLLGIARNPLARRLREKHYEQSRSAPMARTSRPAGGRSASPTRSPATSTRDIASTRDPSRRSVRRVTAASARDLRAYA